MLIQASRVLACASMADVTLLLGSNLAVYNINLWGEKGKYRAWYDRHATYLFQNELFELMQMATSIVLVFRDVFL